MKKERESRKQIRAAKIARLLLILCLAVGALTACGEAKEERRLGIDGFVYMAREVKVPQTNASLYDMRARGGSLYYRLYDAWEDPVLVRMPLEEMTGEVREGTKILFQNIPSEYDYYSFMDYAVGNEGDIYYCVLGYHIEDDIEIPEEKALLIRQTEDGSLVYQIPVLVAANESGVRVCHLAVDGEERVCLQTMDSIYVIDASGSLIGTIVKKDYATNLSRSWDWENRATFLEGPEGRIYLCVIPEVLANTAIYEVVVGDNCRLVEHEEMTAGMNHGTFYGSPYGLLCDNKEDGLLYQYSQTDSAWHPLLRWTDGNASSSAIRVVQLTEDYIAASYFYYASADKDEALYLFTKTDVEQLPEKEVLVLASRVPGVSLEALVMGFNQESDRYHVQLDVYDGTEAVTRIDAALVSSDPPDMLDTYFYLDLVKYAEKGGLADLAPYLERSEVLSREDFLPNLLEGYTIDGKLCCIPSQFSLFNAVIGRSAQVGSKPGWTMADVMALAEQYPNCRLLDRNDFFSVLDFCSDYILGEYIDWENGTCNFDSAQFREFVQWIREHSEGSEQVWPYEINFNSGMPEDVLLNQIWIDGPHWYGIENDKIGGATLIGYPTVDGHVLHQVRVSNEVCIVASSQHKEGAWEFIEYLLTHEDSITISTFYSNRERLRQDIETETIPDYLTDLNGNISYDSEGKPELLPKDVYFDQNGERHYYYYLEKEQGDTLMEVIEQLDFSPESSQESAAYAIIKDELDAWLASGKSLEETTGIIQDRVQLMLNENQF